MAPRSEIVDALEETWRGIADVTRDLTDDQWKLPTGCPGWTVQDNVAHVVGVESALAGVPRPDHELPDGLDHLRNDFARAIETDVDIRRGRRGEEVRVELQDVTARRLDQLRSMSDEAWEDEADGPFGKTTYGRLMGIRVFDCVAHEQDIRRALGRPGGLDGAAGRMVARRVIGALPFVLPAKLAGAATIAFDVTGPHAARHVVRVEGERGSVVNDAAAADVDLELQLELANLVAFACGRADADAGRVQVRGDGALAEQVLAGLAMTP